MDVLGVVRRFFDDALDAIAPPRQASARTKARTLADIPLAPVSHELLGKKITAIMDYRQPAVRDLIRSLKYEGSSAAAALAAEVFADYLREEIASAKQFSARPVLLVPVPLHPSRKRERGFNQIEIVLRALPREFKDGTLSRLAPEILIRAKPTKQQTKLARAERLRNVADAFAADHARANDARIFLIDDVATTGATLVSAGKALERSGAEVTLCALSRA